MPSAVATLTLPHGAELRSVLLGTSRRGRPRLSLRKSVARPCRGRAAPIPG
jgi:hypothetical protein